MKNDALFVRLDSFMDRCRDALDFTRTVIQFSKLERVEIGGTKGKANGKEWEGMGWWEAWNSSFSYAIYTLASHEF